MLASIVLLAAIAFGPLGPVERMTFFDGVVQAGLQYQRAQDLARARGPVALEPSVATASLTVITRGHRRVYDLTSIFPLRRVHIEIPAEGVLNDCGTSAPLVRRGHVLVLEAIVIGKGCAAIAGFIDIDTGRPIEVVVLDHPWYHRFDAYPMHFTARALRVKRVEQLILPGARWDARLNAAVATPWPFGYAAATDTAGHEHLVAFGVTAFAQPGASGPSDVPPRVGSTVRLGVVSERDGGSVARIAGDERVLRLDAADERRFEATQTPTPAATERIARRDSWFEVAQAAGRQGRLRAAIAAMRMVVRYDDDREIRAGDRRTIERCSAFADDGAVRHGPAADAASFAADCPARTKP